jgi:hypothetical protein
MPEGLIQRDIAVLNVFVSLHGSSPPSNPSIFPCYDSPANEFLLIQCRSGFHKTKGRDTPCFVDILTDEPHLQRIVFSSFFACVGRQVRVYFCNLLQRRSLSITFEMPVRVLYHSNISRKFFVKLSTMCAHSQILFRSSTF